MGVERSNALLSRALSPPGQARSSSGGDSTAARQLMAAHAAHLEWAKAHAPAGPPQPLGKAGARQSGVPKRSLLSSGGGGASGAAAKGGVVECRTPPQSQLRPLGRVAPGGAA